MKQADDTYTLELLGLDPQPAKRGRGRPRVDNPLTPAERAKRYRANKKRQKLRNPLGRYRGPYGEVWSGRGLMPRWVRAQIDHFGKKLEDFDTWAKDGK